MNALILKLVMVLVALVAALIICRKAASEIVRVVREGV